MATSTTSTVFINEFHYDNIGTDAGEFIEIAAPAGTDLSLYSIVRYNGSTPGAATVYTSPSAFTLTGIVADQGNGYGTLSFSGPVDSIQNGSNDGFALIGPGGVLIELLSYEGVFTAGSGVAAGQTSTDIGVAESTTTTTAGSSLYRTGTGTVGTDFTWAVGAGSNTAGAINSGQSFGSGPAPLPILSIDDVSVTEGNSGTVTATFTVSLNAAAGAGGVTFDIATADGTASSGSDYASLSLLSQTIAQGQTTYSFTVTLNGDTTAEVNETYFVNLSGVTGATVGDAQALGTITNDDSAPPPIANVYLSEINYDPLGTDAGEFFEVSGDAGTDLTGWSVVLYNGNGGASYGTVALTGTIDDEGSGLGALSFLYAGIQNGAPDGLALVNAGGSVVQFKSYEGAFTATNGAASGMTSVDVGVSQSGTQTGGETLQLIGTTWVNTETASPSVLNTVAPPPPPPPATAIYDIQGAGHTSALAGQAVSTTGIVTAVDSNGFYLQDAAGDGNIATSDAIFVFTSSAPTVSVGDAVQVSGTVSEFFPGGAATGNLSTTQISGKPMIIVQSSGNALPQAVVLGVDRFAPTEVIDDDDMTSFDPTTDGIDFFESLEGMLVTVNDPLAVSGTNSYGELHTVANAGVGATGLSDRGTINIDSTGGVLAETDAPVGSDYNPERIQIQFDSSMTPGSIASVNTGTLLNDVTGVVAYDFGMYEVRATTAITVQTESTLEREVSGIVGTADQMTIGSYNVLNLDPNDGAAKFANIASDIVYNLNAPDIISLEEVQDNDGAANSGTVSASVTLQMLTDAIFAESGVRYTWIDNPFITDDHNGGEPGGNIRVAFLYRDDRVDLVTGSVRTIEGEDQATNTANPFYNARLPLVATFTFNDADVTVVTNHFSSKGGSTPLFGAVQPALNGSAEERLAQAQAVADFIVTEQSLVDGVVVLGDLNEFEFEDSLDPLYGAGLENLTLTLAEEERYTYNFEGNSQSLDHIFTTSGFADAAVFDVVHVNSEFAQSQQVSDHDPLLVGFTISATETVGQVGGNGGDTLTGSAAARDAIAGNNGNDTIYGLGRDDTLLGNKGNDALYGGTGDDVLFGGQNSDQLFGEAGNDRLGGDAGADQLSGGAGLDIFVFIKKFGQDTITDFVVADDTVEFSKKVFKTFAEVQAAWSQDGADVLINSGASDVLRLQNVALGDLTSADFLFV